MEVLSPIKNIENAKIAIANGANALYLASPSFGARVNASIAMDEIKEIIKLANSHDVKTFITFNIVVFEDEIELFFQELTDIYNAKASGVIIQDIAFIKIIKENFPGLEVHASTQMHVHNTNGTEIVKDLGVNRIVVPREMSFERIRTIKDNTAIEIESFIHGALCVCYSGQCYDSTLLDQKSANRGRCSQYCRMPQWVMNKRTDEVVSKGDYPLNLKDLNNLKRIDKYLDSGVDSLKIEGRLKGIDYVGLTTKAYASNDDNYDLSEVYNRKFTSGRINGQNGADLVNLKRANNTGKLIGTYGDVKPNTNDKLKYYPYVATVRTTEEIFLKDNLRFLTTSFEYGQEIEQYEKHGKYKYLIYLKDKINDNGEVYLTKNQKLIDEYLNVIKDVEVNRKEIAIDLVIASNVVIVKINNESYNIDLNIQKSINRPVDKEMVLAVLAKTKNTDYRIVVKDFELQDGLFITNKDLKQLRDKIIDIYSGLQENQYKLSYQDLKIHSDHTEKQNIDLDKKFYINCKTLSQLKYFMNIDDKFELMVDFNLAYELFENNQKLFQELVDKNIYLTLPRVIYDDEQQQVIKIQSYFKRLCISEIGSIKYIGKQAEDIISNFTFNTTNSLNIKALRQLNINNNILSIELNNEKINQIADSDTIVNIYGQIPVMIMDYCPINLNKTNTCMDCKRCHSNNYYIKDKLNRKFPLVYEGNNRIGLYTDKKLSLFDKLEDMKGISKYFINLNSEDENEMESIVESINSKTDMIENSFNGNFYKDTL